VAKLWLAPLKINMSRREKVTITKTKRVPKNANKAKAKPKPTLRSKKMRAGLLGQAETGSWLSRLSAPASGVTEWATPVECPESTNKVT